MNYKILFLVCLGVSAPSALSMEKDDDQKALSSRIGSLPKELVNLIGVQYTNQIFGGLNLDQKNVDQNISTIAERIKSLSLTNKELAKKLSEPKFFEVLFQKLGVTDTLEKIKYATQIGSKAALDYIVSVLKDVSSMPYNKYTYLIMGDYLSFLVKKYPQKWERIFQYLENAGVPDLRLSQAQAIVAKRRKLGMLK